MGLLAGPSGRTHQIRVHAAALGHRLLGDKLYGTGRGTCRHPYQKCIRMAHWRIQLFYIFLRGKLLRIQLCTRGIDCFRSCAPAWNSQSDAQFFPSSPHALFIFSIANILIFFVNYSFIAVVIFSYCFFVIIVCVFFFFCIFFMQKPVFLLEKINVLWLYFRFSGYALLLLKP